MLKVKVKLSLQDASILNEMLKSAITNYRSQSINSNLPTLFIDDIDYYITLELLYQKLTIRLYKANIVKGKATINLNLNHTEVKAIMKAEIPTFNNSYYATVKQELFQACVKELYIFQALLMAKLKPKVMAKLNQ